MFNLVKILGGRTNVPEPRKITVTALAAALKSGDAVSIVGGVVTKMTSTSEVIGSHILFEDAASGATEIIAYDILPGMVFETVAAPSATTFAAVTVGTEYKFDITGNGILDAAPATGDRGVILYDPLNTAASKPGKVLVTFPIR